LAFCRENDVSSKTNLTRAVWINRNTEKSKTGKKKRETEVRRSEGARNERPSLKDGGAMRRSPWLVGAE
jgi:hypothetical protein